MFGKDIVLAIICFSSFHSDKSHFHTGIKRALRLSYNDHSWQSPAAFFIELCMKKQHQREIDCNTILVTNSKKPCQDF